MIFLVDFCCFFSFFFVCCCWPGLKAEDLYDTLHDDIYRLLWDDSMIEGTALGHFLRVF